MHSTGGEGGGEGEAEGGGEGEAEGGGEGEADGGGDGEGEAEGGGEGGGPGGGEGDAEGGGVGGEDGCGGGPGGTRGRGEGEGDEGGSGGSEGAGGGEGEGGEGVGDGGGSVSVLSCAVGFSSISSTLSPVASESASAEEKMPSRSTAWISRADFSSGESTVDSIVTDPARIWTRTRPGITPAAKAMIRATASCTACG